MDVEAVGKAVFQRLMLHKINYLRFEKRSRLGFFCRLVVSERTTKERLTGSCMWINIAMMIHIQTGGTIENGPNDS